MKRTIFAVAALFLTALVAMGQILPNLPTNTVWGRLSIGTGPGQAITFANFATNLAPYLGGPFRTKLPTGTTNFYANSSNTGCNGGGCSDNNDGLTPTTAKKTVLGALYGVLNGYDFTCTVSTQSTVQINMLANEINAGQSLHFGPHDYPGACAGGSVIVDGAGFTYQYDSASASAIALFFTVPFQLQNVALANSLGPCITTFEKASIRFGVGMNFGNCGIALQTKAGSVAVFLNNFTISENASQTAFIQADENSTVSFGSGLTATCTGTPTWTWTIIAQKGSSVDLSSLSWSGCGSVTAQAYLASDGASIVNGAASIPGNVAGATASGGTADGGAMAIVAGGTGATTAAAARTALGLGANAVNNTGTATGDLSVAWTGFTPSPACGSATFTVNSARSKTMGKTTFAEIDLTITAIGSCTAPLTFTLPNTANSAGALVGQDIVVGNQGVFCAVAAASATATCLKNANVSYLVNGRIVASGVYENQ